MTYKFRREDDDQIVEVDFATAMNQVGGMITLPDGVTARRCVYLEEQPERGERHKKVQAEVVSDTLGVSVDHVAAYRANAEQYGQRVEFVPDPTCEHWCKAKFPSWQDRDRYMQFRGMTDKNSRNGSGAVLSPAQFEQAKNRLLNADA